MPRTINSAIPTPRAAPNSADSSAVSAGVSSGIACAWIADLPSWAVKRLEPSLRDQAVVVLEGRRVIGMCPVARKAGVKRGDAVDRARTLCPAANIAQLEPSALHAAWDSALEAMHRVTPWIEPVRLGVAYLAGITALEAEALSSEISVRVGVSAARGSALLAALAARDSKARFIKDEAAFLSSVPVYLLRGAGISSEIVSKLEMFGLKTLGDLLMRVSQQQLEAQFGKEATALWSLVTGGDARPVPVYTPPASLQAKWTFDPAALEPHEWQPILEHLVRGLTDKLATLLAGTITVTLHTALGDSAARQVMKQYSADAKTLIGSARRCFQEAHSGLEIERVTVTLSDLLRPKPYQESLFGSLERPDVREAIKVVHQRYPDRIGRLEIVRPNGPIREKRFRFAPLDGEQPRVKRKAPAKSEPKSATTPKRARKKA